MMGGRTKPLVIIQAYEDRPFNAYSGTTTTPKEISNVTNKPNGTTTTVDGPKRSFKPPGQPPPPPPMPTQDKKANVEITNKSNTIHTKPKAPPPPPIKRLLQNGNGHGPVHQLNSFPDRPPATPTPDYDTSSLVKVTSKPKLAKAKSDAVEMESLESFKLNNPSTPTPRPPSTYFMKQQNGMLTMRKSNPHVSVTIGEYPTNTFRKQPSKLEFLSNDSVDGSYRTHEPVGSRLQSELVQTLSRSNLKKKTDTDNSIIIGDVQTKPYEGTFESSLSNGEPNENFHKRYGHVILPQPPTISIPKILANGNPLSHNTLTNGCGDPNRITITMPQLMNGKQMLSKTESLPHNGILKHTSPMFINDRSSTIKISSPQQKSIKFGQTTTVIGDPEVPLIINR